MRKSRLRHWAALSGVMLYGLFVLLVTMWPTPVDRDLDSAIAKVLTKLHEHGLPGWVGYGEVEFAANVAMFVPLGFFIALLLPLRAWWLAILIGPAFSLGIELTQRTLLPERFATFSDVAANAIGALAGSVLAFVLRAMVDHRDRQLIAYEFAQHGVRV